LKKSSLKKLKTAVTTLIKGVALFALFAASPVVMDEVRDFYWVEIASPKAAPAKYRNRIVASSSQIKYKGKRYTLTNQHVCRVNELLFKQSNFDNRYVPNEKIVGTYMQIGDKPLKILAISKEHDLCILEPDTDKGAFSLAMNYHIGERVTIIGHPRGLPQTLREGRLISKQVSTIPWIEARIINTVMISTISYPGNSGSPVLNRFGNLIGVLFAGQRGIVTEALIVPLEDVKKFLNNYERSLTK